MIVNDNATVNMHQRYWLMALLFLPMLITPIQALSAVSLDVDGFNPEVSGGNSSYVSTDLWDQVFTSVGYRYVVRH